MTRNAMSSWVFFSIFRDDGTPTQYPYSSSATIICGWYGGYPRRSPSYRWYTAARSSFFTTSMMKRARWSSGSQSSGDGGSRKAWPGVYGRNVLLTLQEDHSRDPLSILLCRRGQAPSALPRQAPSRAGVARAGRRGAVSFRRGRDGVDAELAVHGLVLVVLGLPEEEEVDAAGRAAVRVQLRGRALGQHFDLVGWGPLEDLIHVHARVFEREHAGRFRPSRDRPADDHHVGRVDLLLERILSRHVSQRDRCHRRERDHDCGRGERFHSRVLLMVLLRGSAPRRADPRRPPGLVLCSRSSRRSRCP